MDTNSLAHTKWECKLYMARPNGRFCGAKRPKCEAEQPLGFD